MQKYILISIIFLGVISSLLFGVITGSIQKTSFTDYADDAEAYNRMALNLLDRGSFADADGTYYRYVRRSPGYPLFLAGAYSIARTPVALWIAHLFLFAFSIILVYALSSFFLEGMLAFFPAFLFSIAWFTGTFVIRVGSDLLGMTLALLFLWSAMYFLEEPSRPFRFLLLSGLALGACALVRPIVLYFIPVGAIILVIALFRNGPGQAIAKAAVFGALSLAVVAPWMWWSYQTFGTPQLASAGYMLAWRSREAVASPSRLAASGIAAVFGDAVADMLFPGYADEPDPYIHVQNVFAKRIEMKELGIPDSEIEAFFYQEGIENIRQHPFVFLLTGAFNVVRLHNPPNQNGVSMFHFLAESNLSSWLRAALNIMLRFVWYGLFFVAVRGMLQYSKMKHGSWRVWGIPILFAAYTISLQALFTNPEFRYMLPLVPIYLIGFVLGVRDIAAQLFEFKNPNDQISKPNQVSKPQ